MRLTGAALLMLAGLLLGLLAAQGLRDRVRRREGLRQLLERMSFELERFKTPLPELFGLLAAQTEGEAGTLCRRVSEQLEQPERRPFSQIWSGAVSALPAVERAALLPLGDVLGRYGAQEQVRALEAARAAMARAEDQARGEQREKSRIYVGVPAAAAAALAVLLL